MASTIPKSGSSVSDQNGINGEPIEVRMHKCEHQSRLDFACLKKIYSNLLLSDFVFVAEGREIHADKLILALSSTNFYWRFSNDRKHQLLNRFEVEDMSYETLSAVISYVYNSNIRISEKNVESLLTAANKFVLRDIHQACCDFLKDNVSSRNCISFGNIAKQFDCLELVDAFNKFVLSHFSDVVTCDEYLELPYDQVSDLLGNDLLCAAEENILECVLKWVGHNLQQRQQYVYLLIKCVRFSLLTQTYILERFIQEEWFVSDPEYYSFLGKILTSYALGDPRTFRSNLRHSSVLVVAGFTDDNYLSVEIYDFEQSAWFEVPQTLEINWLNSAVAVVGPQIYCITNSRLSSFDLSNPAQAMWTDLGELLDKRERLNIAVLDNSIYIVGGYHNSSVLASVECFDISSGQFKTIASMPRGTTDIGLGGCNGCLYSICGRSCIEHFSNTIYCYVPDRKSWYTLPSLSKKRMLCSVASLRGSLCVVGGFNGINILGTVESYNPDNFSCNQLPDMNIPRSTPGVIEVHGQLYVIGGYNEDQRYLSSVEVFDAVSNTWSMLSSSMHSGKVQVAAALVDKTNIKY